MAHKQGTRRIVLRWEIIEEVECDIDALTDEQRLWVFDSMEDGDTLQMAIEANCLLWSQLKTRMLSENMHVHDFEIEGTDFHCNCREAPPSRYPRLVPVTGSTPVEPLIS
jgi:hypothetical protein